MKPLGSYPTAEQAIDDWVKEPEFLRLAQEKRQKSIPWIRDEWTKAYAKTNAQSGSTGEDLVGKAHAMLSKVLEMGSPGIGPNSLMKGAIELMAPRDQTQLAIDLAMSGLGPEAIVGKAAYRLLAPIIAGAVGGATEPKGQGSAAEGATRAAGELGAGKGIMSGLKLGGYVARKFVLPDLDFARISGWLEKRFGRKIPDMAAFRRSVYEGQIVKDAEAAFEKAQNRTNKALGKGFRIKAPVTTGVKGNIALSPQSNIRFDMSLDEAVDRLHTLEQGGWNLRGEPIMTHAGAAARDAAHEAEGDIASQIDQANPKAGVDWYTAHGRLKESRAIRNVFTEKGALDDDGRPKMHILQQLVDKDDPTSHRYDLMQSMGEDGQKSFRDMLFRGAPEGSVPDRPGKGLFNGNNVRMNSHFAFYAHPNMPYPTRHVGNVPYSLGDGRALKALVTIGPYSLLSNLQDMHSTMPPMRIEKTPAEAASTPGATMPATSVTPADAVSK